MKKLSFLTDKFTSFQFNRYFLVGIVATLVDWGLFYFFAVVMGVHYLGTLFLSFSAGSITNYSLNRSFTFQSNSNKVASQFTVFMVVTIISLGISSMIIYVNVDLLDISKMLSRIITTLIMLGINYFMHKKIKIIRMLI